MPNRNMDIYLTPLASTNFFESIAQSLYDNRQCLKHNCKAPRLESCRILVSYNSIQTTRNIEIYMDLIAKQKQF